MKYGCPNIKCLSHQNLQERSIIVRDGSYFRTSDSRWIQRLRCKSCRKRFSKATFDPAFGQKKRRINQPLKKLLCSSVSMRRAALILGVDKKTIERRLRFFGIIEKRKFEHWQRQQRGIDQIQFDDLQTIEHTKCKPLSVTLAVETKTRKILGFEVSSMPATGHLAKIARKRYGHRPDRRQKGIERLFQKLVPMSNENLSISSDEHPYYLPRVKKYFPSASYFQVKGARGCVAGQGELKKLYYDPLFYINHTFAMLRANINRLVRRSWCTTKCPQRLIDHLYLYVNFHNEVLIAK